MNHAAQLLGYLDQGGKTERILALLRRVKADTRSPKLAYRFGLSLEAAKRPAEAERCFRRGEDDPGLSIASKSHRGTQLVELGRVAEGMALLGEVLAHVPKPEEVEDHQQTIGYVIQVPDVVPDPQEFLRRQVQLFPQSPIARINLVQVIFETGDPTEIDGHLRAILERSPRDVAMLQCHGRNLARLGRKEEAEAAFRHLVEVEPEPWNQYYLARFLFETYRPAGDRVRLEEARSITERILNARLEGKWGGLLLEIQLALEEGGGAVSPDAPRSR